MVLVCFSEYGAGYCYVGVGEKSAVEGDAGAGDGDGGAVDLGLAVGLGDDGEGAVEETVALARGGGWE